MQVIMKKNCFFSVPSLFSRQDIHDESPADNTYRGAVCLHRRMFSSYVKRLYKLFYINDLLRMKKNRDCAINKY
jgi:hypothetical protein